jgi:subtilase family serine protease
LPRSVNRFTAVFACALVCVAILPATGATRAPARSAARRSPTITFYFGLKRPEARAEAAFYAVGRPGSSTYRRFLSPRQIASRYGAGPSTRRAFLRVMSGLGLRARIDPSGVFARVSGTVRRLERAFRVRINAEFFNFPNVEAYSLAGRRQLRLPSSLRPLVQDVVTDYTHTQAVPPGQATRRAATPGPPPPRNLGTWVRGCRAARALGTYSYGQVRNAYGVSALGSGAGASVAILNVGEDAPRADIAANARCFGYPRLRARTLRTDGQTLPFGRGTFEPEEDLAVVRGMAPGLRSLTFSKAWLDPAQWFLGSAQVLAESPLPDTYSMSYGECEKSVRGRGAGAASQAGADLMDSMLVRLGLAGVSTFASAGDFGSTCDGQQFAGVAWPASSPYVTAVGGTRLILNPANQRVNEVVWNDLQWTPANQGGGVGGGGLSAFSGRPPYQRGLGLPGSRRATPDISANASNFPGYPVVLAGHWEVDGGTSASAPLMASAFAVLDVAQHARGRPRLGPLNGLLYRLRAQSPRTFFDIVAGANGYIRRVRAWQARPGYDLASGLGVPQFAQLARAIPPPGR